MSSSSTIPDVVYGALPCFQVSDQGNSLLITAKDSQDCSGVYLSLSDLKVSGDQALSAYVICSPRGVTRQPYLMKSCGKAITEVPRPPEAPPAVAWYDDPMYGVALLFALAIICILGFGVQLWWNSGQSSEPQPAPPTNKQKGEPS